MKPLLLLLAVLAAGCARAPQVAQTWQARSLDDLVVAWGVPDASHQLADGRRMVVYRHRAMLTAVNPYAYVATHIPQDCEVTFTADAAGTITGSRVRGHLGSCNTLVRDRPEGITHPPAPVSARAS